MNLIPKDSSELAKVGKSISITNKLLKEIESREIMPSDDFRVSIPDLNFQKYLIEEYNLDFVDGTSAYGDIKKITEIKVYNRGIKNVEGLQYFTALTSLNCGHNQLKYLDISKNTALTNLFCNMNQLASLDVSKNIALTRLDCWANQLTSLEVSNTSLTSLNCWANRLTSLNVSKNIALTSLYCTINHLSSLDISQNSDLTELDCQNNRLKSLDVSRNSALTWLNCQNNELRTLDLKYNPLLKNVSLNGNPGEWWKVLEKDEE
jgi:hypothetical protein